jgi:hypothetical protein
LVDCKTKKPVKVGDVVRTFRNERGILVGWDSPRHEASTGRIYVSLDGCDYDDSFFPSVCNLEFVTC